MAQANGDVDTDFDTMVLGRRVREARRRARLTLAQLGEQVGRPAPYLSQLENGRVEPKLGLVAALARALGTTTGDLLAAEPPSRRAELELELIRLQARPGYRALGLPELRPSAKLPDDALEHLVLLANSLLGGEASPEVGGADQAYRANIELRAEMRQRGNYFADIERIAAEALAAVGYGGNGPVSERVLIDLAGHFGFTVERVQGMPRAARSVTDQRARVVYIPQRNDVRTREARSVVLQTLGHFALDHAPTRNFRDYLRQRIESNYFAGAVLVPETPAVAFLQEAKRRHDISVEDLKEVFYVSYEMAAHRLTNLATRHLGIPVHFLRTDPEGAILKAYENDGIPFPADPNGALEGERVSRNWGARQAWSSSDSFALHYQYTRTDVGEFWSCTYLESEGSEHAITIGARAEHAHHFRGANTLRRVSARSEDNEPPPELLDRWEDVAWPSAAERSHVLSGLAPLRRPFSPFPGVDLVDVYRFLELQPTSVRGAPRRPPASR